VPDRYADSVRARRAELRAQRERLLGGHRSELRSALALSRVAAAGETANALADLARDVANHLERADRTGRRRTSALLGRAVADTVLQLHEGWAAALRPALRRIAAERSLPVEPGWPRLPAPRIPPMPAAPPPTRTPRALLSGAAQGAALWRLLLVPAAVLPLCGLPAWGGPALAPLAAGSGVAALVVAARSGRTAAERAALRRHADTVLAAAAIGMETDLQRRLLELERTASAVLDAGITRRRAEVDSELALLAPAPERVRDG
jgi:hypothetical protein